MKQFIFTLRSVLHELFGFFDENVAGYILVPNIHTPYRHDVCVMIAAQHYPITILNCKPSTNQVRVLKNQWSRFFDCDVFNKDGEKTPFLHCDVLSATFTKSTWRFSWIFVKFKKL